MLCLLTRSLLVPRHARYLSVSSKIKLDRLDRILSSRGAGSRSEVSRLINKGRVTINGVVVKKAAQKYESSVTDVRVNGVEVVPVPLLVAYNKPVGVISSIGDPSGRSNLSEIKNMYSYLKTMHPVGRLDRDTSGLLLFSRSGELTHTLLQPKYAVEREYEAVVEGNVTSVSSLAEKLQSGVETTDGVFSADLTACVAGSGSSRLQVVVREGKHRMVRRMLHNAGHSVMELKRLRYGSVTLGDLPSGHCRGLTCVELEWILNLTQHRHI
mmetsp:Transcript_14853/g.22346  ORF Transcript_14853/g.22346 Transcript_14853/m.22346 type:complete len:269 (+) Transcript_14853:83-889(+)